MMTFWMIETSPALSRAYLNKKRDQAPVSPFCICMEKLYIVMSAYFSDRIKVDDDGGDDDISYVLF